MKNNFTLLLLILAICFLITTIIISEMYIQKCKELEKIKRVAYFQSYLPEDGKKLILKNNASCYVYRCYRLNNIMDCYITEGIEKNDTCIVSGPTYGIVCRNNIIQSDEWKCYEMSSAKREYYLRFMIPILYYDKINRKCCWITEMENNKPIFNCTSMKFFDCLSIIFS